ncbi:glucose-6-phosphate isomerase [Prochlorococcus sp. MIT 1223]|uniref:glucose-6-phosphate isomerase n=1 Tax=Prochlorococcus sp. MIT 1223 TaxID=3096217 RepID=UPI002A74E036|nr:glucose-6-phosphate isomerase [Prochlorococcus sp. MIT 1223]
MTIPELDTTEQKNHWGDFCDQLWFSDQLGMWLDISKMNINSKDYEKYKQSFSKSFIALEELENGSIANKDENRQVGHYWLRDPLIAPDEVVGKRISSEICSISKFGKDILDGTITNQNDQKFRHVLWIGIGGSGLGPLLIVESLQELNQGINFHFIDNIDTDGINRKLNNLGDAIKEALIVVVSKSGGTPEPNLAMDQVKKYLSEKGGNWPSQSVAITMQDSNLDKLATEDNWLKTFDLPDWVGGRTSITGAVGLLPIALINRDVNKFLEGSKIMDSITRNRTLLENPAALLALAWLVAGEGKGLRDMVILPYKDSLQVFSKYLQQLIMESLGKREDREGNIVFQGISVYGNKGSTDQHAYVQQLRDGIDNFFVNFIEVLTDNNNIKPINGRNPGDYLSGFLQGTRSALSDSNRQNLTITLTNYNEKSLGALVALFERAVGIYAEIVNINAYHQPGVEAGKKAASDVIFLQSKIENILSDGIARNIEGIATLSNSVNYESIFMILRHLSKNNHRYSVSGDWNNPKSLIFKYS